MNHTSSQYKSGYQSGLYRIVFECVHVKYAIAFLFATFLLQPIAPAYANELLEVEEEVSEKFAEGEVGELEEETEELSTDEIEDTEAGMSDSDQSVENVDDVEEAEEGFKINEETSELEIQDQEDLDVTKIDLDAVVGQEQASSTAEIYTETLEDQSQNATSSVVVVESSATTSDSNFVDINEDDAQEIGLDVEDTDFSESESDVEEIADDDLISASTSIESQDYEIDESTTQNDSAINSQSDFKTDQNDKDETDEMVEDGATSTEAVSTTTKQITKPTNIINTLSAVTNNENRHQFSIDDCTSVGGGAFYCSNADQAPVLEEDGVFAVPDADGDMEIMVRVDGEEEFITQNTVDDAAPYYDAFSEKIVWHVLKNDRYQIASYDLATGEQELITNTSYNNMEPVAHGDLVLWQAWIKNNWEIMMYDGSSTTRLTNNDSHDVAPHMRGGYVLWQTQFSDGWRVAMYDFETDDIQYIGEGSGAQVENPRLVLVYDALSANGDVETVGYDFESGEIIPLSQMPTRLPEKLPGPEQTGETRALIQNKSPKEEQEIVDFDNLATSTKQIPSNASTTINNVDTTTLDLLATTTDQTVIQSSQMRASSTDVVVPNFLESQNISTSTTVSEDVEHIPDVVVQPVASSTLAIEE